MKTQRINYYIFDQIVQDEYGSVWGHKGDDFCEVFYLSADDTEESLASNGFAKCDAPNWPETMVVEETAYAALN